MSAGNTDIKQGNTKETMRPNKTNPFSIRPSPRPQRTEKRNNNIIELNGSNGSNCEQSNSHSQKNVASKPHKKTNHPANSTNSKTNNKKHRTMLRRGTRRKTN